MLLNLLHPTKAYNHKNKKQFKIRKSEAYYIFKVNHGKIFYIKISGKISGKNK